MAHVSLRLADELLERADALALALSKDKSRIGQATRSDVLRAALARGLEVIEGETGVKPARQRRSKN